MTLPTPGTEGICAACSGRIVYIDPYWDHVDKPRPRHIAVPTAWLPDPASSTAVTLDADAVTLTIAGVGALPQGSVITVSVVVGPDGPVVIPPAATPPAEPEQPKKKRYINGD